jgi:CRP-like cAMP-binding protein
MAEGRTEQLRRLAFFRDFGEAQLWELLRWTRWEEAAGGDVLVREGEQGHSLFVIVEGRVAVRKGDLQLAVLGPGECFGEIAYLSKRRRSASVVAMERASVLRVNAQLMERASQQCQLAFQRVLIATLIERLVDTTQALATRP